MNAAIAPNIIGKTRFQQSIPQKCANGYEVAKGLNEAGAHGNNAPHKGKAWQPDARCDLLQDEITWDLAEDVSGVEDGKARVILVIGDVNLIFEAVKSGVAHVGPVEERA